MPGFIGTVIVRLRQRAQILREAVAAGAKARQPHVVAVDIGNIREDIMQQILHRLPVRPDDIAVHAALRADGAAVKHMAAQLAEHIIQQPGGAPGYIGRAIVHHVKQRGRRHGQVACAVKLLHAVFLGVVQPRAHASQAFFVLLASGAAAAHKHLVRVHLPG